MRNKLFFVLLFVLLLIPAMVFSQENIGAPIVNESDALAAAAKWADFVGQANVPELEKLLADRYIHIHATALVETKTQFLDAFRNGTRKYDPIKLEDLTVQTFGCFGIVRGKFQLKAFTRGKTIEGVNRFSLVIARSQKGYEVVSFQATPIPKQ